MYRNKGGEPVDYVEKVEKAIDYIEENLMNPLTVQDISKQIFSSKWHFQRIFRSMTGVSLYSYIRRRRLSEAAKELLVTRNRVIDVAFKYQYKTPETFLREFKKEYGVVPSHYRKQEEHLLFGRMDMGHDQFRPVYEAKGITWREVVRKETRFIGKRYQTTMQNDRGYSDVPEYWANAAQKGIFESIPHPLNENVTNGIYAGWDIEDNFDILIGTFTKAQASSPPGYVSHLLPAGRYIQFTVHGNEAERIVLGWKYIYGSWFAETGYEHGDANDFDQFDERFQDPDDPVSEIYIPVK